MKLLLTARKNLVQKLAARLKNRNPKNNTQLVKYYLILQEAAGLVCPKFGV